MPWTLGKNRMDSMTSPTGLPTVSASHSQTTFEAARKDYQDLVMRTENFDVHARVSGLAPRRRLQGRIVWRGVPIPLGNAQLCLFRDGERLAVTTVSESGEFTFSEIPGGLLNLQIDLPCLTVVGTLDLE